MKFPEGTYFRKTRAKDGAMFTVELRREEVPVGCNFSGPRLPTTVTVDLPGARSAAHILAAESEGVRYGQVRPALRLRHVNLNGIRVEHTFWEVTAS